MHDSKDGKAGGLSLGPAIEPGSRVCFGVAIGVLVLAFCVPLVALARFAAHSELFSHILLVPFISLYLVWLNRGAKPPRSLPNRKLASVLAAGGAASLAAYGFVLERELGRAPEDYLALSTVSFVLFFAAVCAFFLGRRTLASNAFPIGFLLFLVPIPLFITERIESFLQYASADTVYLMFSATGTPTVYTNLTFMLPGISISVAPQCSGIHSSLALFITSVLAGYFFLHSPWKRAVLALAVVPLAILRNGLRIYTIGELCVHIGPEMINSYIHHHGGPIFFIISLIPFFLLLRYLTRSERTIQNAKFASSGT
jgi:exosortase C (VPDSG-CTERM-specific)